jgi:tetratricopeptide (TPR) repeat protein
MLRSGAERWLLRLAAGALSVLAGPAAFAQLPAGGPSRLVDVIEVSERDEQADITIVFNCSMRFVNTVPASEGTEVHIQLAPLPDCNVNPFAQLPTDNPPLSGAGNILGGARLESLGPGQITLTLTFRKSERFVIAQGVDPRGLRLRLINRTPRRARVLVGQSAETVSYFAVNLDSQPKPFDPAAVELAHERLNAPAYVAEAVVDGETWYRLRVGPIERRVDAERLLNLALPDYPRAWLAIADDRVTTEMGAGAADLALPPVQHIGSDPPLPPEALARILADARAAMTARDYPKAVALLTQLQRQPEFPDRARAQELLGLARERAGQLAQAKAEYVEYLRRYPQGEAAERVAYRLHLLQAAEAKARTGIETPGESRGWETSGGIAQLGRYDNTRVSNPSTPIPNTVPVPATTTQDSALFTDIDLLTRRRGDTLDWIGRLSAGYDKVFTTGETIDPTRVSLASIEALDKRLGLLARVGRQAQNTNGILGTFDGIFLSWQFEPSWAVNAAAGFPVSLLTVAPQTNDVFETLALAYTPPNAHWDGSIYAATEKAYGLRDRQAVGLEGRYLAASASVVAVADYDTFYHSLNTASLLGTLQLPARWNVSFDAERRNSPVLTTGNALIGQPFTDLDQMQQVFTPEQIYQLARDRTPVTEIYSLTANRPLGQRFQLTAVVAATETGATPASGGVPAVPATGLLLNYQLQLYGTNLWGSNDFNVLTLTDANTEIGRVDSVGITSRFPVGGAWRLSPRLTVERLKESSDGSTEVSYLPALLLDYQRANKLLQFEAGGQLGTRQAFIQLANGTFVQTQNTVRYYAQVSYRISFGP